MRILGRGKQTAEKDFAYTLITSMNGEKNLERLTDFQAALPSSSRSYNNSGISIYHYTGSWQQESKRKVIEY